MLQAYGHQVGWLTVMYCSVIQSHNMLVQVVVGWLEVLGSCFYNATVLSSEGWVCADDWTVACFSFKSCESCLGTQWQLYVCDIYITMCMLWHGVWCTVWHSSVSRALPSSGQ